MAKSATAADHTAGRCRCAHLAAFCRREGGLAVIVWWVSHRLRSAANSPAVAYRSAGFFARRFRVTVSSSAGMALSSVRGAAGSSNAIRLSTSCLLSPATAGARVSSS